MLSAAASETNRDRDVAICGMRGRWAVSSRCRDALAGVARPACALTTWLSGGATEFGGTSAKAISGAKARCAAGADQDRHPSCSIGTVGRLMRARPDQPSAVRPSTRPLSRPDAIRTASAAMSFSTKAPEYVIQELRSGETQSLSETTSLRRCAKRGSTLRTTICKTSAGDFGVSRSAFSGIRDTGICEQS